MIVLPYCILLMWHSQFYTRWVYQVDIIPSTDRFCTGGWTVYLGLRTQVDRTAFFQSCQVKAAFIMPLLRIQGYSSALFTDGCEKSRNWSWTWVVGLKKCSGCWGRTACFDFTIWVTALLGIYVNERFSDIVWVHFWIHCHGLKYQLKLSTSIQLMVGEPQ